MAIMKTIHCSECGETKQEVRPVDDCSSICKKCKIEIKLRKRTQHFKGLEGLTVEERIKKIEEWIYDYKPPVNPKNIRF